MELSGSIRVFVAVAVGAVASPSLAQFVLRDDRVNVDFAKGVDFSRFKTYQWKESQQPADDPTNHLRITRAVESELEAKGLEKVDPGKADLKVRYYGKVSKKLKSSSRAAGSTWEPGNLRTMIDVGKVEEGTLILELYEAGGESLVWRAMMSETMSRPDRMEQQINSVVSKLLSKYPPKEEASPTPEQP
jgi:hypothetical protein